jgi:hypothetical protein
MPPMKLRLLPHSDTPPKGVRTVTATISADGLIYSVEGAEALKLPAAAVPERRDGLWATTCFELFLKPAGGDAYREFNFSPSRQWAAYRFTGYREGMEDLPLAAAPVIVREGDRWTVTLSLPLDGPHLASLTAVIEEADGTKSYWALAHPTGKPDFHHADCFVLELPAPDAP